MSFLDKLNPFSGNGIFSGSSNSLPGKLFDPGAPDRNKAETAQKEGVGDWNTLGTGSGSFGAGFDDQGNPLPAGQTNAGTFAGIPETANLQVGGDGGLSPYQQGPTQRSRVEDETYLRTPEDKQMAGLSPDSNWAGKTSSYDALGPSAYGGLESAFSGMGPSAGSNIAFDKGALGQEQQGADYFSGLSKSGTDPIADAQYAQRKAQAEQTRRAQSDADLAALEQKGGGNIGGQLLSGLSNSQKMTSDMYGAGMDANAMAAARRDNAAQQSAGIGHTMGTDILSGDVNRASAVDRYNTAKASGLDDAAARKASGLDQFATTTASGKDAFSSNQNSALDTERENRFNDFYGIQHNNTLSRNAANTADVNRNNSVSDQNTDMANNATYFNKVTAPQQRFANETTVTAGKTGQLSGLAGTEQDNGKNRFAFGPFAANTGANVAKAVA